MVRTLKDLAVIIDHFDKYPLITSKWSDFELFKQVVGKINRKEHLTLEGLQQIVNIRASINNGLSPKLKEAFPETIPVHRPIVKDQVIKDPHWLAGFSSGECCFYVNISKNKTHRLGESVTLSFRLTQHSRDAKLIKSLVEYFGCGNSLLYPLQPRCWRFCCNKILRYYRKDYSVFQEIPNSGCQGIGLRGLL